MDRARQPTSAAAAAIDFRDGVLDAGPGGALVQAMREEIAAMYGGLALDGPEMPRAGSAELSSPDGAFLVGYRDGRAICCGGIKRLDERACEIKRMYVAPAVRGSGVGRALLLALEKRARAMGYELARLDTGPRQPGARRLYVSAGYREIENFNGNPVATFFAEKRLVAGP